MKVTVNFKLHETVYLNHDESATPYLIDEIILSYPKQVKLYLLSPSGDYITVDEHLVTKEKDLLEKGEDPPESE